MRFSLLEIELRKKKATSWKDQQVSIFKRDFKKMIAKIYFTDEEFSIYKKDLKYIALKICELNGTKKI